MEPGDKAFLPGGVRHRHRAGQGKRWTNKPAVEGLRRLQRPQRSAPAKKGNRGCYMQALGPRGLPGPPENHQLRRARLRPHNRGAASRCRSPPPPTFLPLTLCQLPVSPPQHCAERQNQTALPPTRHSAPRWDSSPTHQSWHRTFVTLERSDQ